MKDLDTGEHLRGMQRNGSSLQVNELFQFTCENAQEFAKISIDTHRVSIAESPTTKPFEPTKKGIVLVSYPSMVASA